METKIQFTDRISVAFHNTFGGAISNRRAARLAENIRNTNNAPNGVLKALDKKSQQKDHTYIKATLALYYTTQAKDILSTGQKKEERRAEGYYNILTGFSRDSSKTVFSILNSEQRPEIRMLMGIRLENNFGTNFTTNSKLYDKSSKLSYQLQKAKSDLKKLENKIDDALEKIDKNTNADKNPEAKSRNLSLMTKRYLPLKKDLLKKIDHFSKELENTKKEIIKNRKNELDTIIKVTEENLNGASPETKMFYNQYKEVVNEYNVAPYIIRRAEDNIALLKEQIEKVDISKEALENLVDLLVANDAIKMANEVLIKKHEENEKLEASVSANFVSAQTKNDQISNLISSVNKKQNPSEIKIELPNVPTDTIRKDEKRRIALAQ